MDKQNVFKTKHKNIIAKHSRLTTKDSFNFKKCKYEVLVRKDENITWKPIYGRFMGFYENGFLSTCLYIKVKTVFIKTHKTAINRPVDHTEET